MNVLTLLGILAVLAVLCHLLYRWRTPAFAFVLLASVPLLWVGLQIPPDSLDVLGLSLALDPAAHDFLAVGLVLTCGLAILTTLYPDRVSLPFLYWSWVPWLVALVVSDFVIGAFAWTLGLVVLVLAMKPRKYHRASGSAYFLVLVVIAIAALLLANRLVVLYPLTPESTWLVQLAVLMLAWGLGLLLALFPFCLWVGPLTDDAPLPVSALLLGLGQPIGLRLLFDLLTQYSWVVTRSDLYQVIGVGGAATVLFGGLMAAFERRGGRLLGYLAVFSMGVALLNLSQATEEGVVALVMALVSRAAALVVMASAISLNRAVRNAWLERLSIIAFLLAALDLVGIRLGVSFYERWQLLAGLMASDTRLFALIVAAHIGVVIGSVRFASGWYLQLEREHAQEEAFDAAALRSELEKETAPLTVPAVLEGEIAFVGPERVGQGARTATLPSSNGGSGMHDEPSAGEENEDLRQRELPAGEVDGQIGQTEPPAGKEDGETGQTALPVAKTDKSASDYIFEEHLKEIVSTLGARMLPLLRRVLRSLPIGVRDTLLTVWDGSPVWGSIGLLLLLTSILLALGADPQLVHERVLASLGQLPFVH